MSIDPLKSEDESLDFSLPQEHKPKIKVNASDHIYIPEITEIERDLVKRVTVEPTCVVAAAAPVESTFKSRKIEELDHPLLIILATFQDESGNVSAADLDSIPDNFDELKELAKLFFDQAKEDGKEILVTETTINRFTDELSKRYQSLYFPMSYFVEEGNRIYEEYKQSFQRIRSLETDQKNLANFCGVSDQFAGGNFRENCCEMSAMLSNLEDLSEEEKKEFSAAFEAAGRSDLYSESTVEKIQRGQLVVIPAGFSSERGGHCVNVVFYKDHFVICNRGMRSDETSCVEHFRYDPARFNEKIVQFLMLEGSERKKDVPLGLEHMQTYLYKILPKILEATKVEETAVKVPFKEQKIGNCTKASPMVALKMGIYLKELEKGKTPKQAARSAKKIGAKASYKLRKTMIDRAKIHLESSSISPDKKKTLENLIASAESKLKPVH